MKVYLATGNPHKVGEMQALLGGLEGLEILGAETVGGMPEVLEDAETFSGNAALKARGLQARLATPGWVLADDSGLTVDALDGRPGVYSARYAGPGATDHENMMKVLSELEGIAETARGAAFICSLALADPSGVIRNFEGICRGKLLGEPRGTAGFGYDPIFVPEGYAASFGELGAEVKANLSHRARAAAALRAWYCGDR